jgi:hypothetical protein
VKLADVALRELIAWVVEARERGGGPVEVHVLAQGYELRCSGTQPLRLEADVRPSRETRL